MNNQPPTNRDKLRDTIVNLRQQRDAHQMDESDYIDRVMAEVEQELREARINELGRAKPWLIPELGGKSVYFDERMAELEPPEGGTNG